MKILEAKINMFFQPIADDKDVIKNIADNLKGNYQQLGTLESVNLEKPTGENEEMEIIPHDIPRIVGKNANTELSISLNRAEIHVVFDSEFSVDISKCIEYIQLKSSELYKALDRYVSGKYLFSGVTILLFLMTYKRTR